MRFNQVLTGMALLASVGFQTMAQSLDDDNIQDASQSDGNPDKGEGEKASKTDDENFINFCSGKTKTNGLQNEGGSCNGIPMGEIPSSDSMTASLVVNPQPNDKIEANKDINFQVQMRNFAPGTFTNADNTYYSAPQQLKEGKVIGHTHITVQKMNSMKDKFPPDAQQFAFFKGVNDEGNGKGKLSALAEGGLPDGTYRVCTMSSAANHQPVLMPVAQRGAQDDCQKFTVGDGDGGDDDDNNNKLKFRKNKRSFAERLVPESIENLGIV